MSERMDFGVLERLARFDDISRKAAIKTVQDKFDSLEARIASLEAALQRSEAALATARREGFKSGLGEAAKVCVNRYAYQLAEEIRALQATGKE